jgi:putative ABC transport system permease protein
VSLWELALRNVLRNRRRSLLTAGVVVFGFAAFALAGGFMSQTFEALKAGTIHGGVGHLQFARRETFEGAEEKTLEFGVPDDKRVGAILKGDPGVEAVLPRLDFVGLLTNGSRSIPYLGVGLDAKEDGRAMETKALVASGKWLPERSEGGVVLGTLLASSLQVKPGDTVTLFSTTREGVLNALDAPVVGLVDIPVKELNERYLATSLEMAQQLLAAPGMVSKFVVLLRPNANLDEVQKRLLASLERAGLRLDSRTWRQLAAFYSQVRLLYLGIFGFMGAVLVIVVLLACANTMTMAAAERTREIGTLRAIGTPAPRIWKMFVAEGVILAFGGCAVGALLALAVRAGLNASHIMLPPPPGATHGAPIHVAFYGATYLAGLAAMVATLCLASYLPARRAASMPIVDALAHV